MKKITASFVLSLALGLFAATPSYAVTILPAPGTFVNGLPVAIPYDDFFSYSNKLLTQLGFSGFDGPTGVGGQDVVLYTGANGIDNNTVTGGFIFEDPQHAAGGNQTSFTGTWGAGNEPNGPVTVDNVVAYLEASFGAGFTIPAFTFDLAQAQNQPDLNAAVQVTIFDPVTNTIIEQWSLDNINNSEFDPNAPILVNGEINLVGADSTAYHINNNQGSGKADFTLFAPSMNLALYTGQGYEFHVTGFFSGLSNGPEEAFLSGAFAAPRPPVVTPEPTTLAFMAMGLTGLYLRRKKA
jgi:hypothetical protein